MTDSEANLCNGVRLYCQTLTLGLFSFEQNASLKELINFVKWGLDPKTNQTIDVIDAMNGICQLIEFNFFICYFAKLKALIPENFINYSISELLYYKQNLKNQNMNAEFINRKYIQSGMIKEMIKICSQVFLFANIAVSLCSLTLRT